VRFFLFSILVLADGLSCLAAPALPPFDPAFSACRHVPTAKEAADLAREKSESERRIKALRVQIPESDPRHPKEDMAPVPNPREAQLRQLQSRELEIAQQLECRRLTRVSENITRGPRGPGPSDQPRFVEVPVLYATDRMPDPSQTTSVSNPSAFYSGTLNPNFRDFSFGTTKVSIPTNRKPGDLNLPPWWKFATQADPSQYFVLRDIVVTDRATLIKELNEAAKSPDSSLLLFVHGFNVTFADAALRTAQLAHDLQFPGKVMLYSWPSVGRVEDYWKDEDSAGISTRRFQPLLQDLIDTGIKRIFIIAHSMGTRIVIRSIVNLRDKGADLSHVSELILAAADFNEVEFSDVARGYAQMRQTGTHTTIYAASNDFALRCSKIVHSYYRLGESSPKMAIFTDIDSVDASNAAPGRRAFGHSYVSDSMEVLGDMQDVVLQHLAPGSRGLEPIAGSDGNGWRIPKLHP
jgi:esterase/lipase superfamily enzyme